MVIELNWTAYLQLCNTTEILQNSPLHGKTTTPFAYHLSSFHSKKTLHLTVGTGISDAVSTAVLEECLYTEVLHLKLLSVLA